MGLANEANATSEDWTKLSRRQSREEVKEPIIKKKMINRQYMPKKPGRGRGGNIGRTSKHAKYLRREREDEEERARHNEEERRDKARWRREDEERREEERIR